MHGHMGRKKDIFRQKQLNHYNRSWEGGRISGLIMLQRMKATNKRRKEQKGKKQYKMMIKQIKMNPLLAPYYTPMCGIFRQRACLYTRLCGWVCE